MLGHKTLRCTYTTTFSEEMNQGKTLSPVTNCLNKLCSILVQLVYTLTALKIIILYVQGCEKRKAKHMITDQSQNRTRIRFFIKLDRYLSIEMLSSSCRAMRLEQLLHKKDELGQILSPVTICLNKFCSTLVQLVSPLTAFKIIILYVQDCEKRKPKHIIMDWMKNNPEKLNFINLDRYLSVELLSSYELEQLQRSR